MIGRHIFIFILYYRLRPRAAAVRIIPFYETFYLYI